MDKVFNKIVKYLSVNTSDIIVSILANILLILNGYRKLYIVEKEYFIKKPKYPALRFSDKDKYYYVYHKKVKANFDVSDKKLGKMLNYINPSNHYSKYPLTLVYSIGKYNSILYSQKIKRLDKYLNRIYEEADLLSSLLGDHVNVKIYL